MPKHKGTPIERFWQKVDKTPGQGPNGECWTWTGKPDHAGYGIFCPGNKIRIHAHRWIYEYIHGPLGKLLALHKCDNPPCVRPDHIEKGDQTKNMRDCKDRDRTKYGERHHNCYLSKEQVELIRNASGTHQSIADEFGTSRENVSSIKRGIRRSKG